MITEPDDFYPSLTGAFTYDDTWYCPPKDFSTLGLVYNADMLEAAGVEPPTNMEELAAAAEALTADGVVGLVVDPELARWGVFMLNHGGYIVDEDVTEMTLDTEENRAGLQYLADLFAAGYAATPAAVEAGWGGEALGLGKAAMVIEGNWIVGAMARRMARTSTGASSRFPRGPPAAPPSPSPSATASAPSRRTQRRRGRSSTTSPVRRVRRRGPRGST